ncbi:MAG TPA: hypothetical protein VFX96_05250 [Pyrinomonadaceae bacterium]|nr:hypothetical protein [Pyrinomonadaceae bacterium]
MRHAAALFSLFALLAGASLLGAGAGGAAPDSRQRSSGSVTPCDAQAYVKDDDPNGMNVRSGPGSDFKVVHVLKNMEAEGITVHITGWKGAWMRIDRAEDQGRVIELFKGEGWVFASLLGVDGQGGFNGGTPLYQKPAKRGRIVARVPVEGSGAVVRGCRGRWLYVEYEGVKGWGVSSDLCYLSITNCN